MLCFQYEEPSYEELQNMEYLDMIINETYRHHPVAPGYDQFIATLFIIII
jgi:hypothetical protein